MGIAARCRLKESAQVGFSPHKSLTVLRATCAKPRSEKSKLDRFLNVFTASGAAIIPGFVLIGIEHDGFLLGSNNSAIETNPEIADEDEINVDDDTLDQEMDELGEDEESVEALDVGKVITTTQPKGVFKFTAPIFDPVKGIAVKPISFTEFGTAL